MARYRLDKEPGIAQLVLERILITFFLDFDCFQAIDFIDSNSGNVGIHDDIHK